MFAFDIARDYRHMWKTLCKMLIILHIRLVNYTNIWDTMETGVSGLPREVCMNSINTVAGVDTPDYINYNGQAAAGSRAQPGTDFSAILADALKDQTINMGVTAGGGLSGAPMGYVQVQNQGIEQTIMAAASSG